MLKGQAVMVVRQYRVRGVVQGVGFRPFIHRLAREFGIKGWVLNDTSGVLIEAHCAPESHRQFLQTIGHQAPPAAVVASIETKDILDPQAVEGFSIRESVSDGGGDTLIPPDLSVCPECHAELTGFSFFSRNPSRYFWQWQISKF